MAALPPITQVSLLSQSCLAVNKNYSIVNFYTQLAGNHWTVFEGYWSQLDLQGSGKLEAGAAAAFLKKSQLREPILHKVLPLRERESRAVAQNNCTREKWGVPSQNNCTERVNGKWGLCSIEVLARRCESCHQFPPLFPISPYLLMFPHLETQPHC